ncbi:MAG: hypothetical protein QMB59_02350 [Bacteroidales bacterium]
MRYKPHLKWCIDEVDANEKVNFADERSRMIASGDVNHVFECAEVLRDIVYELPNSIEPKQ